VAEKSALDKFDQFAVLAGGFVMAGAGTGSEAFPITTGLTNRQKIAWLCDRIEYQPHARLLNSLHSDTEAIYMLVTASASNAQDFSLANPSVYDMWARHITDVPAAGLPVDVRFDSPIVHTFPDPILILPQILALHLTITSAGAIATNYTNFVRIWYKEMEISAEDWYDLLQLRMPLGAGVP